LTGELTSSYVEAGRAAAEPVMGDGIADADADADAAAEETTFLRFDGAALTALYF